MKSIMTVMALVMVSTVTLAEKVTAKHDYIGSISGEPGCKMPINPDKPEVGDCNVKKRSYEVGTNTTRQGDVCTKTVSELNALNPLQALGHEILAPDIKVTTNTMKCSDVVSSSPNVFLTVSVTKDEETILSSSLTTLDGEPAPISVFNKKTYLADVKMSSTQLGTQAVLTPGEFKTGVGMMLMPVIQANKQIKTDVDISISDLEGIDEDSIAERVKEGLSPTHESKNHQILMLDQNKPSTLQVGTYTVQITAFTLNKPGAQ